MIRRLLFVSVAVETLLLAPSPSPAGSFHALTDRVSLAYLTTHIRRLEEAGGHYSRVTYTAGSDSGVAYIKQAFDALPNLSIRCDTFYVSGAPAPYKTMPLVNIEATLNGRTNPSAVYVIGAHHDCSGSRMGTSWSQQWFEMTVPGADDNATGVAGLLEIARILSDTTFGFRSDVTIKFVAFAAEESSPAYSGAGIGSHQGSIYYAQRAQARGEQILGMISVDMVGYNPSATAIDIVVPTSASAACQQLGDQVVIANNDNAIGLALNSPPYNTGIYSDHKSFWDAGYPAILLIERGFSSNPYYHKSTDTTGTLNLEQVRRTAKVTLATVAGLAGTVTGVEQPAAAELPASWGLSQNYPNPFNPSTVIGYTVGDLGRGGEGEGGRGSVLVRLSVYDLLGREVAVLVNEEKAPGSYEVTFDGGGLASGSYIYRLQAGNYVEQRKMLFLR